MRYTESHGIRHAFVKSNYNTIIISKNAILVNILSVNLKGLARNR